MKFKSLKFNKTALYHAVEKENTEIVKILLSIPNIEVNTLAVLYIIYFTKFKKKYIFNSILNSFFYAVIIQLFLSNLRHFNFVFINCISIFLLK